MIRKLGFQFTEFQVMCGYESRAVQFNQLP